jgi:hypothetical protein
MVATSIAAAAGTRRSVDPDAQLYIALWANMSGMPDTLNAWLGGATELGVPPPAGAAVTGSDLQTYLKATAYFTANPGSFPHMEAAVAAGMAALPPDGSILTRLWDGLRQALGL